MTGMSVRSKLTLMLVLGIGMALYVLLPISFGWVDMAIIAVFVLLMILLTANLYKTAANPIDRMNKTIMALTEGKMDMTLRADAPQEAAEVGILENNLAKLALSHHNFKSDLDDLLQRMQAGQSDLELNTRNYPGIIRDMAVQINALLSTGEKMNARLVSIMDGMARGVFNPEKSSLSPTAAQAVDKLANQMQAIKNDIGLLAQAAGEGRFNQRATGNYSGEWLRMAGDMHSLLDAVHRPVTEIANALERLESCAFSTNLSGNFKGEFERIKNTIDKINALFAGHLNELASVLNDISYGRAATLERDYRGAFSSVQSAVAAVGRSHSRLTDDAKQRTVSPAVSLVRPAPVLNKTPPRPAATSPATSLQAFGTVATPPLKSGRVVIPSGAHEYNRKDFGKYR